MINTTLCYIEKDGCYLMMHRVKKENDLNRDKWVGVGGKFEEGESPDDCLLREVKEETGLSLVSWSLRGVVTFLSNVWESEYMFLYTAEAEDAPLKECEEGVLEWIRKKDVYDLPIWIGDKIFFRLLEQELPCFSLKLSYSGDTLIDAVLNGTPVSTNPSSV